MNGIYNEICILLTDHVTKEERDRLTLFRIEILIRFPSINCQHLQPQQILQQTKNWPLTNQEPSRMSVSGSQIEGSEKPQILTKKVKYLTTIAVYLECITFGCALTFFSPVLVDLKHKYNTDIDTISKLFIILTLAYLGGSIAGGFLYGRLIKRQQAVIISLAGISISLFITPHCPTLLHLFINVGFLGFCCGAYDTAQIVWIMEMWQSESGPFLQAQHCCFALGSNLPPLLTAPYLNNQLGDIDIEEDSSLSASPPVRAFSCTVPFTIVAGMAMINALYEVFLITCYPYTKPEREITPSAREVEDKCIDAKIGDKDNESAVEVSQRPGRKSGWHKIKLITLSALFLGFYQGMELCSIQFIPTLAQTSDLKMSEAEGALVLSGLTGAFAIGRAVGILITLKISSQHILCTNLVLMFVGNAILLFWANSSREMLWAGCIVVGFGLSTMYASFCAFMERHLVFTDFVGCIMLSTGSVVAIIYPAIVGKFVEQNPGVVSYTIVCSTLLCAVSFVLVYFITTRSKS